MQGVKGDEITASPRGVNKLLGFQVVSRYLILRVHYLTIDKLGH